MGSGSLAALTRPVIPPIRRMTTSMSEALAMRVAFIFSPRGE
jgi:hypothetical protein